MGNSSAIFAKPPGDRFSTLDILLSLTRIKNPEVQRSVVLMDNQLAQISTQLENAFPLTLANLKTYISTLPKSKSSEAPVKRITDRVAEFENHSALLSFNVQQEKLKAQHEALKQKLKNVRTASHLTETPINPLTLEAEIASFNTVYVQNFLAQKAQLHEQLELLKQDVEKVIGKPVGIRIETEEKPSISPKV